MGVKERNKTKTEVEEMKRKWERRKVNDKKERKKRKRRLLEKEKITMRAKRLGRE